MRRWRWFIGFVVVILSASAAAQTRDVTVDAMRSEKRVALVIGNGAYATSPLKNPVNDARAMAQALKSLGFDVIARENVGEKDMRRAIFDFGDKLQGGGVGLFFYAGHGTQVAGRNFLIPVGAEIRAERDVELEAIDVARVLARMDEAKNRLNIVVLDACRDNPFARSFRSASRGLAQIDAPTGTLIAYATAPGKLARDGEGNNGLYTGELLRAMREPNLTLESVFKRVRQAVRQRTNGEQVPWEASSVEGEFIFSPKEGSQIAAISARPEPKKIEIQEEVRQQLGSVALSAKIDGIEVWLDGQRIGETKTGRALIANNVPEGAHRVVARKAGYKEWRRDVQIAVNQRTEIVIDIETLRPEPPKTVRGEDGAEMVLVPDGEFWMGSDEAEVAPVISECKKRGFTEDRCKDWFERELPRHRVVLDPFYIDRYEVTNALFEHFVNGTSHRTTAEREGSGGVWHEGKGQFVTIEGTDWRKPNGPGSSARPDHPVVQVSRHDADAYCRWAGKRLPREAEWEKAARGTGRRRYPWGEEWDTSKANGNMSVKTTTPVGSYSGGVSLHGAHDMAGNVAEWVADWFDRTYYQGSPERNPQGPSSGNQGIVRGGSWRYFELHLRSASRLYFAPDARNSTIGFRCAKDAPK